MCAFRALTGSQCTAGKIMLPSFARAIRYSGYCTQATSSEFVGIVLMVECSYKLTAAHVQQPIQLMT
jgi:hypothetical protein